MVYHMPRGAICPQLRCSAVVSSLLQDHHASHRWVEDCSALLLRCAWSEAGGHHGALHKNIGCSSFSGKGWRSSSLLHESPTQGVRHDWEEKKVGLSCIMNSFEQTMHRIKNQYLFKDLQQIIPDFLKMLLSSHWQTATEFSSRLWVQGLLTIWYLGPRQLKSVKVLLCISTEKDWALYDTNSAKGDYSLTSPQYIPVQDTAFLCS